MCACSIFVKAGALHDTSAEGLHFSTLVVLNHVNNKFQTNVWYLSCVAGKDEQLFPNAEKFDPARWARDKPNPFAILPFVFGPRSCYGNVMYNNFI